jgi:hypothetical protein
MVHAKRKAGKATHGESSGRNMSNMQPEYLSYLLRLWRENDSVGAHGVDRAVWRASLERPQAAERQGFASLEELFVFLREETRSSSPQSERPEEEGR